ncbi:MAG: hypothetical protein LBS29_04700 [Endomicrobium sp.]|nr:hypothetical protein [Endomicrobium sp.]
MKSSYNYSLNCLEDLGFVSPIPYLLQYNISRPDLGWTNLYKRLLYSDNIDAVYAVNNTFVMKVFSNYITAEDVYTSEIIMYEVDIKRKVRDLYPVGYVKTRPLSKEITILPYLLVYDRLNAELFLHGKWISVTDVASSVDVQIKQYASLLKTDKEAIYLSKDGDWRLI